jgi:MFS family permease
MSLQRLDLRMSQFLSVGTDAAPRVFVGGAFAQLPTGALVDKVGPRILLAAGLALWSVAQACGGLVTSMRQFVATCIALGIDVAPQ